MKLKNYALGLILLLAVVSMTACSSTEDKAQTGYSQAVQVEKSGDLVKAESLYRQIVADFPATSGATRANERLVAIEQRRVAEQRTRSLTALSSVRRVIEGYEGMFDRFPASIEELDGGDYFFDSGYLAESVPENYEVYLALGIDPEGYRLWSFPQAAVSGYLLNGKNGQPQKIVKTQAGLDSDYQQVLRKGRLTVLKERVVTPKG